jgi:hypothetical protein
VLALPPTLRRDLERQVRERTPWHVRVTVRSTAETTTVGIWSARWFTWHRSRTFGALPDEDPLLFQIQGICLDVQNFMRGETGRWWPTELEDLPDRDDRFANAVLPHASRNNEQVLVEWRQGDRSLLTFDPLRLA